jgi:phage-related protein
MYQRTDFSWNSISSSIIGLKLVKVNIQASKENFASSRSINSERIQIDKYHYHNYKYSVDREYMRFTLELASEKVITPERCEELARIFVTNDYVDFLCYENNHIYNCICLTNDFNVFANGYYLTLECECSSPYSCSFWQTYVDNITSTKDIEIYNNGSILTHMIAEISPITTGSSIKLINKTNSGMFFELATNGSTQLFAEENIKVDFKKNKIKTDALAVYRYDNVTKDSNWLFPLVVGRNIISVSPCSLKLSFKYYYLT